MKSPAFQFYSGDFLVGTMGMSDDEVGVYIKMLAFQWERGSLPADPKSIQKIIHSKRIPSEEVLRKFQVCDDGLLRNSRLEKEREKQLAFRESRVLNANKRWNKESTSNARASSSTCKTDALQSSSSFSSSIIPPNPQGGNVEAGLFGDEHQEPPKPRCLPDNWRKIPERDRKRQRVIANTPSMIEVGSWFGRKPETLWSISEAVAMLQANPSDAELVGMGRYYTATIPTDDFRRRDVLTLLNNWSGELDRARKFVTSQIA